MIIKNNIYLKFLLILTLVAAWAGGAWAQRFEPTFASTESEASTWHYIIFPNNGKDKIYADTNTNMLKWTAASTVPNDNFKWYLIGTRDDFILKTVSGKYAYTSNTGTGTEVAYSITDDAAQATHFNLINGNNANTWSIHRKNGGDRNCINHRNGNAIMEWSNDNGSSILFSNPNEHIRFSDAPSTFDWAPNTYWFSLRNNRSNQAAQYNRTFVTSSAESVGADSNLLPILTSMPNDRGSYWCFVGDNTNGFVIQNAAYGPDFVLGISGNQSNATVKMLRKGDIPSGYTTTFTAVDNSVIDDASFAYAFRLGTSGNSHIHVTNGKFIIYNHTAITGGDTGSAFKLTLTDDNVINALTAYDVYHVTTTGGTTVSYNGSREVFGRRDFSPYFILAKGEPEVAQSDIQTTREIEGYSIDASQTDTYLKLITIDLALPVIVHRQSYLFDKLNSVTNAQLPGQGFIKKGDGMKQHPLKDDVQIQYTSNYTITQYVKHYEDATHTNSRQLFMPTIDGGSCEVTAYQRWYDYKSETMPRTDVINVPALNSAAALYKNGVVVGTNNSHGGVITSATATLPAALDEYWLAVDQSRYNDGENLSGGNLKEPSLTMRVIYHLVDAKVMADAVTACEYNSENWQEQHTISYPNKKLWNGNADTKSGVDYIGLNHEFSNYWCYSGTGAVKDDEHLEQMANGKLIVELDPSSTAMLQNVKILTNGDGGIQNVRSGADWGRNRFIGFQYPRNAEGRYEVPVNSKAVINVYMQNAAGTKFQLARINLTFIDSAEPLLITEVYGKDQNGAFRNSRSMEAMKATYGNPVSELTFDHNEHVRFECPTAQGNNPKYKDEAYAFPLDFSQSSYGYHGAPWASRGEYVFRNGGSDIGKKIFYPVDSYKEVIDNGGSLTKHENKYFLYVDASEQPGQVMSIPIPERLCSGSRMFCYGWFNSATQILQESVGIVLNIVGKVNASDETGEIIYSFNPGLLSTKAFDSDNNVVETVMGAAPWRQIGFSFIVNGSMAGKYAAYELQVMNNCYSTNGGDFTLDNFYIFTTPPKGNVDFTTPLCSDKVRHAKIHADYDMLWEVNGINEEDPGEATLEASYCFLDAELFDNYEEGEFRIKDIFMMDENTGNHNLNPAYPFSTVEPIINRAFGKALVGRRCTSSAKDPEGNYYEDHGFHSYHISTDYESIEEYSYNDSRCEVIYREKGADGVRRIVFKEDVVRGEMEMQTEESGRQYYPHMRPSRTYYLVFAPHTVLDQNITDGNVGTGVFEIHASCSFFGKFTTKDPMHVILDNADIESDLPIKAVCHGETVDFSFDMPALKVEYQKPVIDEAYCISDESLDNEIVPGTQGKHHYHYQEILTQPAVKDVVINLPYDWWLGGEYRDSHNVLITTFGGSHEEYSSATHPTLKYNHPEHDHTHAEGYKKDGEPVVIAQAMSDFRFFYPDFGKDKFDPLTGKNTLTDADWSTVTTHDYNNDSGYSLLMSEILAIRDLVEKGILVLHRTNYDISLKAEKSKDLSPLELKTMSEEELNKQVLELAVRLSVDDLKQLESIILDMLSPEGRKGLTFEVFVNLKHDELVTIADKLGIATTLSDSDLRKSVETRLKTMSESELRTFAQNNFPDLEQGDRAYLVIRALNKLSVETTKDIDPTDEPNLRAALKALMIDIFSGLTLPTLHKMLADIKEKLTEEEYITLMQGKDPATMSQTELATKIEGALAVVTNNIIADLNSDRYIYFTLIPIMPSQKNFVDEPYIFCPEPRGVKVRITSKEPMMLDGFADMEYPMDNVPVRLGLPQIKDTYGDGGKTLRIPVRGLKKAVDGGVKAMKLAEHTAYENFLFLTMTDDPAYQQAEAPGAMSEALSEDGIYTKMVGTIEDMVAVYPTPENLTPDNYLVVKFIDTDFIFREGYTYRIGVNFMEYDGAADPKPTISCPGTMLLDLKIVPEYQKWTAEVNTDWTNDDNWARADRDELNAGNVASDGTRPLDAYITNAVNQTGHSFVPMYFTNVLIGKDAIPAVLYKNTNPEVSVPKVWKEASRSAKTFLEGLDNTATDGIIYDMEVKPSDGSWHSSGNFECGLFGTYISNGVTFLPGGRLMNAQHLDYQKAWVEYELDTERWYTLSSPLQDTYAGEWYAPTGTDEDDIAKQQTPHFYDINYNESLNDRFRPAIYQRSWDSESNINNVYYKDGTECNAYITDDWSFVYNDVLTPYSAGGFSVKVTTDFAGFDPADGKALIRMPKADTQYTYYDVEGATGQKSDDALPVLTNRSRLWSDKLSSATSFEQTITNAVEGNNYFLVGNPFMTNLDMEAFFDANPQFVKAYWVLSEDGQTTSVRAAYANNSDSSLPADERWTMTLSDDHFAADAAVVAPLQGFFVKTIASTNTTTVNYTASMQTVAQPVLKPLRSPARPPLGDEEDSAACDFIEESINSAYTVSGMRVEISSEGGRLSAPRKGVYIVNGKKIVVR